MPELKIVIGDPKTKRSAQKVIEESKARTLFNKKIGDKFDGAGIDLAGYEFEITGGSDTSGTPMRKDVDGKSKKQILLVKGLGHKKTRQGIRKRITIAGNTIGAQTSQINVKILKYGKEKIEGLEEKKSEENKGEDSKSKETTEQKAPKE